MAGALDKIKSLKPFKPQKTKDEIFWAIFEAVIRLDILKGHMNWKISEVARSSKISRTLIYYYFGNSREHIIHAAIDYLAQEYFGLSESRLRLWSEGKVLESVLQSRSLCQKAPQVHLFYMTRRDLATPVGEKLRDYEQRYRQKLHEFYPRSQKDDIDALAAVFFSFVSSPELSDAGIQNALNVIQKNLTFKDSSAPAMPN